MEMSAEDGHLWSTFPVCVTRRSTTLDDCGHCVYLWCERPNWGSSVTHCGSLGCAQWVDTRLLIQRSLSKEPRSIWSKLLSKVARKDLHGSQGRFTSIGILSTRAQLKLSKGPAMTPSLFSGSSTAIDKTIRE